MTWSQFPASKQKNIKSSFHIFQKSPQVIQTFRDRWMSKYSFSQIPPFKPAHHGHLNNAHEFTAFNTKDSESQYQTTFSVHNSLHYSTTLVSFQCSCHISHGH